MSLFNRNKLAKRVIGRALDYNGQNATTGPIRAVIDYLFQPDDRVQQQVDKAKSDLKENSDNREAKSFLAHQDGLNEYLGLPQHNNSFVDAEYTPTKGTLVNGKYLKYMREPKEVDHIIDMYNIEGKRGGDFANKGFTEAINPYIRNFQISSGYDPKRGEYAAIYDTWDYNLLSSTSGNKNSKPGDNIGKIIGGKPFDIYDRIYLDDYYQVPEEKRGATYIPEIRVIAKGQDDSSLKLPMQLNQIAKSHNIQLKKDPFKEDLSWLTPQMMESMNGDEILDEAKKHGFKQGGKLNYLNYINI